MSGIPASVQQPANTITAIKTFMVTFLQCSFSASSSSRLMHSTGAAFNISIALTNIRIHAVPTVNLFSVVSTLKISYLSCRTYETEELCRKYARTVCIITLRHRDAKWKCCKRRNIKMILK